MIFQILKNKSNFLPQNIYIYIYIYIPNFTLQGVGFENQDDNVIMQHGHLRQNSAASTASAASNHR